MTAPQRPPLPNYLRDEVSRLGEVVRQQVELLESSGTARASLANERGIATGAGDSHAASVYAQLVANHRFVAADPYELRTAPPPGSGYYLIAVSVKGRTREVINCVKRLRGLGWSAVAVTSDPNSELGRASDSVVRIAYGGGELPVGVGNFASTLTALTWILGWDGVEAPSASTPPKELANALAGGVAEVVTVGEGLGIVPAYFTCLKLHEALCTPCRSYSIEQFLHAPLYSLTRSSLTIIFPGGRGVKSAALQGVLKDAGLGYAVVRGCEGGPLAAVLDQVAQAVLAIAEAAEARGVTKPCFEERSDLLRASTPVIYTT